MHTSSPRVSITAEPLLETLTTDNCIMMTLMKWLRILIGKLISMVAILGGGVVVPFTLWVVYKLNLGINSNYKNNKI
jgi:hypothetical protein